MSARGVIKKLIPAGVFKKIEPFGHLCEAVAENIAFGFPARGLKVIGVTGTAGKTTTCTLITHLLRESGFKVAMMTTISIDYGDGRGPQHNTSRMTSLGSLPLLRAIKKIRGNGVEWLVLETTSHALAQHRVWGVPYSIVGYTNLSHDNVDYHGTFENYRRAKLRLFEQCNRNRRGQRVGVVNADDANGHYFAEAIAHPVMYGVKKGDLRASDVQLGPGGSTFTARLGSEVYRVTSHLPGEFNVYNTLAAIGVARAAGLTREQIEHGVASLPSVEGRMNLVDEGQNFGVIVDYAPTPEGFTQVYAAVKPTVKGKIITVFGSAGRRDKLKRPIQGEIAGRESDIVVLTEEDDRDQDGMEIIREIAAGAEKAGKVEGKDMFLVHEREVAVQRAIDMAKAGDLVLLLGKGEETVIVTNKPGFTPGPGHVYNESTDTVRREYNETAAARAALRKRLSKE
ncbi:MAG TPA: UDP-N-acetylmuramoyl-L-alanyl-D-glutamate--2,6-diaminopimelate ligase [Candidatus Saccharimonadales bacterium]